MAKTRQFNSVSAAAEQLLRENKIGLQEAILVTNHSRNPHAYCRDAVHAWLREHGIKIMARQVQAGGADGAGN